MTGKNYKPSGVKVKPLRSYDDAFPPAYPFDFRLYAVVKVIRVQGKEIFCVVCEKSMYKENFFFRHNKHAQKKQNKEEKGLHNTTPTKKRREKNIS